MSDIIVTVDQGKISGKIDNDYHGGTFYSFLGIPYAKAPIGDLRFKAPEPPEPWVDIRDGTKPGPECPALDMYFGYFIGNEDNCLNLNVYTKEIPTNNHIKKPVMVWIHGGAFLYGNNKVDLYGPDYLLTQDIVLVSINYRLGIFGFLSLKDQSLQVPGNAGIKDMVMALRWVQKNIANFGGDPDNVKIFGESAGSASVHYLTLYPTSKGLFHKAIMQSGSALSNWAWGAHNAHYAARHLDYKDADEKVILQKLQNESSRSLVNAQLKVEDLLRPDQIRPWGPVIEPPSEHAILTENPLDILKAGKQQKIPMIIGYNSNEGLFYQLLRNINPKAKLPKDLQNVVPYELNLKRDSEESKAVAKKLKTFYFNGEEVSEKNIEQTYRLLGDILFVSGIQRSVNHQLQFTNEPIYMYRMSVQSSLNIFKALCLTKSFKFTMLCNAFTKLSNNYAPALKNAFISTVKKLPMKDIEGVAHADDLTYLFPNFLSSNIELGSEEDMHILRFVQLWTNFARTGNPTSVTNESINNITWKAVEKGNLNILEIGKELKMIPNVDKDRMELWDGIYKEYLK